jgi:gamma-glutamyltranspeptidase
MMVDGLTPTLVFKDGQPVIALGTFASSLFPANYQVLVNMIDFGMNPEEAVLTPRFGMYSLDLAKMRIDTSTNMIDKRFCPELIEILKKRGINLTQDPPRTLPNGYVDIGDPVVVKISHDNGSRVLEGMTPEWLYGLAAGY